VSTEVPAREGSGVLLIDGEGRVLLQQRDDDLPPAGYGRWAIPGGRREAGESPLETAIREFREETGLELRRLRFFETAAIQTRPGSAAFTLHLFFADDEVDPSTIQVNEGLDFRFFAPAEAVKLSMNPGTRRMLERFLASDQYRGTVAARGIAPAGASVLELDRWGRVLLQLRDADLPPDRYPGHWSLPGGLLLDGEGPDAAAFREFEEETGQLLDTLNLFRVYHREPDLPTALVQVTHVYYVDADIDEAAIVVGEGQEFRYFHPDDIARLTMPPHTRTILEQFFASPAYRAMFH
jgi:8-oxo-dGTP diphosphatase